MNDTYGHSAGDKVLQYLATKITEHTAENGTCYRFGGEEFVIILPCFSCEEATEFANTLRIAVSTENTPIGKPITFSAGVAELPEHTEHFLRLIELADECLYHAKETGRNKVVHADELMRVT